MDTAFAAEAVDSSSIPVRVKPKTIKIGNHRQTRSQKFAMGGLFGGLGAEPQTAGDQWGYGAGSLGAKPPAAGGMGVWGPSPQRSKILHFFAKITSF